MDLSELIRKWHGFNLTAKWGELMKKKKWVKRSWNSFSSLMSLHMPSYIDLFTVPICQEEKELFRSWIG